MRERGAATLLLAVIMLSVSTLMIVFAANFGILSTKSVNNMVGQAQAIQAANAGMEYGIVYLQTNKSTITANPIAGFIAYGPSDSSITNVTLANSSKYSITYSNPIANNYNVITIRATGTNSDNTATASMEQKVSAGAPSLKAAITTQGNLVTSGNVTITGAYGVQAGGSVTQSGNVHISSVTQNDTTLKNMSSSALFSSIFGVTQAQMQTQSNYYSSSTGINYNSLTGKNWINSSVTIAGNYTIGTPSNPVLLIINGNFTAAGTITINGLVYVTGMTTMSGNATFNGGVVSQGAVTISGSVGAYNGSIVGKFTSVSYSFIPGSWKDF